MKISLVGKLIRGESVKQEKSCGAIVFDGDKVLLVTHQAGHTAFPKGHMEKGETEEETAKREILEETGIVVNIDKNYRYTSEYSPREGIMKTVVLFLGYKVSGDIHEQEIEISSAMWIDKDTVLDYLTHDDTKQIFNKLLEDLNK